MKSIQKNYILPAALILLILILDQVTKFVVKTNMYLDQQIPVFGNWFIIYFTENEGMAFGMKFAGNYGKVILSVFRIIAVSIGIWYLISLIKKNESKILIISITLILAGAIGNVIDCCFYGLIFNDSLYNVAQFMPQEGGYAPFLYGKVVDMFYFPLFTVNFPTWLPVFGGNSFTFFSFIFNVADIAVTVGVFLLAFNMLVFEKHKKKEIEQN